MKRKLTEDEIKGRHEEAAEIEAELSNLDIRIGELGTALKTTREAHKEMTGRMREVLHEAHAGEVEEQDQGALFTK